MGDLVFDVSATHWVRRNLTARDCADLHEALRGAKVEFSTCVRKLLPCAQRPANRAHCHADPRPGTTPANPAGGGDL